MSGAISMVHLRTHVNTPFTHLKRLFRDGPHISHLHSSQVTQRISVNSRPGLGWAGGLARGSRKSNFTDREAPSGKYSTCANGLPCVLKFKITDSIFSAEAGPLECRMLPQILRTAFSPQFQAVHKIPSGSRSAARKKLQGALWLCFPDSLKSELLALPTPSFPT